MISDDELLYLIRDNNEAAERYLYAKYEKILRYWFWNQTIRKNEYEDEYIQEGRMILAKVIRQYKESCPLPFYYYFGLCMRRRSHQLQRKMFRENAVVYQTDFSMIKSPENRDWVLWKMLDSVSDPAVEIWKECVLSNLSLKQYCRQKGLSYERIYYRVRKVLDSLRKKVD